MKYGHCNQRKTDACNSTMTSTEKGPESDVASAPDFDSLSVLVSSLQTRLVSNGEWNKLLRHIRMSLEGSAWEEDMRVFARGMYRYF